MFAAPYWFVGHSMISYKVQPFVGQKQNQLCLEQNFVSDAQAMCLIPESYWLRVYDV